MKRFESMAISNLSDNAGVTKNTASEQDPVNNEPMSIDEVIDITLVHCQNLPHSCDSYVSQIKELRNRLARGQLHLAVLGQFNRGKSTFINALIRQKILPTSVLPVTSVPTFISYGEQMSCTVRFLKQKPDLVVKQSIAKIVETLTTYVAEENNPRNQFCVRDVQINCPSPILENGTVLIDTPGFGSTYVHNTRTALDSLVDCDAALFLLSADPPMTQTEVEFLKQVQQYVPRIFFILNKIDLLTNKKDVESVDHFIRQMLISRLGYSSDIKLFHVCAARAERASECNQKDTDWVAGNMETIKSEILEFMIREKYFTLSQALNDKLEDAFNGILSCLQNDIDDFKSPLDLLKKERQELSAQAENIKRSMEKELKLVQIEKTAILKFISEQFGTHKKDMETQVFAHLDNLLNNSSGNMKWIQGLAIAIGRYMTDHFSHLLVTLIAQINKPIRKAAALHSREYGNIADAVQKFVMGASRKAFFHEKLESMEIAIEESWKAQDISKTLDTRIVWTDYLRSRSSKNNHIRGKWESTIKESITQNFDSLDSHLKQIIEEIFDKIKTSMSEEYFFLSQDLDNVVKKKETAIEERLNKNDKPVESLQSMIDVFSKTKKQFC